MAKITSNSKYGAYTTKKGVRITRGELRRFNESISQANKVIRKEKRRRKDPTKYGDFAMDFRNSDIERFNTRESFLKYLRRSEEIGRGTYFRNQAIKYRKNYLKSLDVNYGQDGERLAKLIKKMKLDDFMELVEKDIIDSVGYIYHWEYEGNVNKAVDANIQMIEHFMKKKYGKKK